MALPNVLQNFGSWNETGWRWGPDVSKSPSQAQLNNFGKGIPPSPLVTYEIYIGMPSTTGIGTTFSGTTSGWWPLGAASFTSPSQTVLYYQSALVPLSAPNGTPPAGMNGSGSIPTIQVNYPQNVSFLTNSGNCDLTVFGYDWYGLPMQENITSIPGSISLGKKAFLGVTGVWVQATGAFSVAEFGFGIGKTQQGLNNSIASFGLPYALYEIGDAISISSSAGNIPISYTSPGPDAGGLVRPGFTGSGINTAQTATSSDTRGTFEIFCDSALTSPVSYQITYLCRGASTFDSTINAIGGGNSNWPTLATNGLPWSGIPVNTNTTYGVPQYYVGYPT